jgi:hypothetical protein
MTATTYQRSRIGVVSRGGYHSIDPGKLTTAPMFALEAADRIEAFFQPATRARPSMTIADEAKPMPLVVALVPTWSAAPFIGQTLSTLAAQTYPRLEILISDDASPDGNRRRLRVKTPRIPHAGDPAATKPGLGR